MANESAVTIVGNITADPELRFTEKGIAVTSIDVACTPRYLQDGEWVDGTPTFMRCNIWREMAENVYSSLRKGARVIVTGRLSQSNWTDKETGTNRSRIELDVDDIGVSLKFGTTEYTKNPSKNTAPAPEPRNARAGATRSRTRV